MIEQLNTLAQTWWTWSVSVFWQVGLLILLVACVDRLIRKWTWPQVRYALWLMILVKLILPPGWHMPSSLTGQVQPLAARVMNSSQVNQLNTESITLPFVYEPVAAESTMESFNSFAINHGAAIDRETVTENTMPASVFARPVDVLPGMAVDWRVYAMGVWLLGAAILCVWLASRLHRLRRGLPEHHVLLPASFYRQVEKCAHAIGLRRLPRVIVTNKVIVPAVMGTLRPVLLMPQGFLRQLSRKDTEHMLLHEFAHIKRGDLYVHGIYLVLQITFWYNPLLWLVRRQLHHLRELCCDATVARLLQDKAGEYRQTLLDVARRYLARSTEPSLGLLGLFEDANRLAVRLSWLKKPTWRYARIRTLLILVLVTAMTTCVLPMAQANNSTSEEPDVEETAVAEAITDTDATTMDATESLSAEQRAQLQRQIQQLARQQQQLQVQLQQLNQALKQSETSADQAPPSQVRSVQPLVTPAKVKRLDAVKDKMNALKDDITDSEYWEQWADNMEAYVNEVQQKVNSPEFQARIKLYADKFNQEVGQRIKAWSDSNEVKQWQQDLKAWEKDMQHWTEDMANVVQHKWMPQSHNSSDSLVPEQPHLSSPPAMPKMPPMPPLPKLHSLEPTPEVRPVEPQSKLSPPLERGGPIVSGSFNDQDVQVIARQLSKTINFPILVDSAVKGVTVTVEFANVPLEHALDIICAGHNLYWNKTDHYYLIFRIESPTFTPKPVPVAMPEVHVPEVHMQEVHIPDIHIPVEIHEHNPDEDKVEYQRSLHMNLAFTGTSLNVQNNVGRISVQGSQNNNCVTEANIRVKANTPEAAEKLAKQAKLIWDANDARAVLKPELPNIPDGAEISIDMTLIVPQQSDLVLTTQVGDLKVIDMQGMVKGHTNVGSVFATATGKDMALETNVGDVSLSVAKDASATIDALTNIGSIESDFDFTSSRNTSTVHIPMALGSVKRLTLGSGEVTVHLKSNVGSVRVGSPGFVKP